MATTIGRYLVTMTDDQVCIYDPYIDKVIYVTEDEVDFIFNGYEEAVEAWFDTLFIEDHQMYESPKASSSLMIR